MTADSFHHPDDPTRLYMENDLLKHEVRFLKGKLASAQDQVTSREGSLPRERVNQLKRAESDIRWFVRRLASSPGRWIFRRWRGFRVLEDRYGARKSAN